MTLNIDLNKVEAATEYKTVPAGGYVCRIILVENVPEKEYLKIEYDIDGGEFKGYYQDLFARKGFWGARFIKSYKETALPFFKAFTTSVEESNPGYKWDNDEQGLLDKVVGLVLAEEEYKAKDGSIKTRLYVDKPRSIEAIRKGDFQVPPKKVIPGQNTGNSTGFLNDEEKPW